MRAVISLLVSIALATLKRPSAERPDSAANQAWPATSYFRESSMKTALPIEILESRIGPASLSGNVLTYTDLDGDLVTITFSPSAQLTPEAFSFDTAFDTAGPQQLQEVNLATVPGAGGMSIAMKVMTAGAGDGRADIGAIDAHGLDLGKISLAGDLGRIMAGSGELVPAVKSLSAYSMGAAGLSSQGGNGSLASSIVGSVGSIKIVTDVVDAAINLPLVNGRGSKLGLLSIGGDLQGGDTSGSGSITVSGMIAKISIRGAMEGGAGDSSGVISAGALGSVAIGDPSGLVRGETPIALQGGPGANSGALVAQNSIKTVQVFGSVVGVGPGSGSISSKSSGIGSVTIHGDLLGGDADQSGVVSADLSIGKVRIDSSLTGGLGSSSGAIDGSGGIGVISIGHNINGGDSFNSGTITSGRGIGSVHVGGDVLGGRGNLSGAIHPDGSLATVQIGGSLTGGAGDQSGIVRGGSIQRITIAHNLSAGAGLRSGMVESDNSIGIIIIGGDATGSVEIPASIVARGALRPTTTTDIAFGTIQISGRAEFVNILAGFDETAALITQQIPPGVNGNAQIKSIRIGGTAAGVNVVAGVLPGADGEFGTDDDSSYGDFTDGIDPVVGKLTVAGQWLATEAADDAFVVTADRVLKCSVNRVRLPLTTANDAEVLTLSPDTKLIELV